MTAVSRGIGITDKEQVSRLVRLVRIAFPSAVCANSDLMMKTLTYGCGTAQDFNLFPFSRGLSVYPRTLCRCHEINFKAHYNTMGNICQE